ncbi:MAG TPA: DinB family protein [Gemmatimonas sp.]|nr:DinB family protein [Gemmatimonas sp.]
MSLRSEEVDTEGYAADTTPYEDWGSGFAAIHARAQSLISPLGADELTRAPRHDAWSVEQILEHLTISNSAYAASMTRAIDGSAHSSRSVSSSSKPWKPTLVGRLLRRSMDPSSTRKLPAPGRSRPGRSVAPGSLDRFVASNEQLARLLERAQVAHAANERFASPLAALIRLNVGDGFTICVAHSQRHLQQIERTISAVRSASPTL